MPPIFYCRSCCRWQWGELWRGGLCCINLSTLILLGLSDFYGSHTKEWSPMGGTGGDRQLTIFRMRIKQFIYLQSLLPWVLSGHHAHNRLRYWPIYSIMTYLIYSNETAKNIRTFLQRSIDVDKAYGLVLWMELLLRFQDGVRTRELSRSAGLSHETFIKPGVLVLICRKSLPLEWLLMSMARHSVTLPYA